MGLRDPVSSASHLLFAIWAGYALLILLRVTCASSQRQIGFAVFGGSMVLLYLASGLFHGVPFTKAENPTTFRFFQRLDQSAIFILIAGTNTPLMATLLDGRWRRWCLGGIWLTAAAAIVCLWLLPKPPHEAIVAICLGMGWLGLLPITHYYRAVGWRAMNWVWAGCILYMLGTACELTQWPVVSVWPVRFGFHEIFHLICAAASLAFFLFVARYVIPYRPPTPELLIVTSRRHSRLVREKGLSCYAGQ
jgi:hemolysin III